MNKKLLRSFIFGLVTLSLATSCAKLNFHKKCCAKNGEICTKNEAAQPAEKEVKSEKKVKKSKKIKAEKTEVKSDVKTEEKKN
jgi:hypothetical protein